MYRVTRLFLSGNLKGITCTEVTSVKFTVGKVYESFTKSTYKVLECVPLGFQA